MLKILLLSLILQSCITVKQYTIENVVIYDQEAVEAEHVEEYGI
jgi:hypothetical protein